MYNKRRKIVSLALALFVVTTAFALTQYGTEDAFGTQYFHTFFNETGLPSGTEWNATYNGALLFSTSTSIEFTETVSNTYSYTIPGQDVGTYLYTPSPSSGTVGSPGSVSLHFNGANLTLKRNPMDAGQTEWFYTSSSVTYTAGFNIYLYINGANTTSVPGGNIQNSGSQLSDVFSSSGSYSAYILYAEIQTPSYHFDSPTLTITVNPSLSASIASSRSVTDYGQPVTFTSSVSGGTPPYTYQWFDNNASVSWATSADWTVSNLSVGTHTIFLEVTDSVGDPAHSVPNASLPEVIWQYSFSTIICIGTPLNLSISKLTNVTLIDSQQNVSKFHFSWYVNGVLTNVTTRYFNFFANSPGQFNFTVVFDGIGGIFPGHHSVSVIINVTGTPPSKSVLFFETGLPIGAVWSPALFPTIQNATTENHAFTGYGYITQSGQNAVLVAVPYFESYNLTIDLWATGPSGYNISKQYIPNPVTGIITLTPGTPYEIAQITFTARDPSNTTTLGNSTLTSTLNQTQTTNTSTHENLTTNSTTTSNQAITNNSTNSTLITKDPPIKSNNIRLGVLEILVMTFAIILAILGVVIHRKQRSRKADTNRKEG